MGWIIVGVLFVLIVIAIVTIKWTGSARRAAKAKSLGLVECPKCHGRGSIDVSSFDDYATIRCDVCKKSDVHGYITPEERSQYYRPQKWMWSIFIVFTIVIALLLVIKSW